MKRDDRAAGGGMVATDLRARVLLTSKEFNASPDYVTVRGMASTPRPDRIGDVVESKGAKFKTPLPLLLDHDSRQRIGQVVSAKATAGGIEFEARIPKVKESGVVQDRTNEAIHSLQYGLLDDVSIGFRALDKGMEPIDAKDPWGAQRFTSWEWLELSLVTVPANPDATITSVKSTDVAAPGRSVVRLNEPKTAGATATPTAAPKENEMSTIQEKISKWEAKHASLLEERSAIMKKAEDDGDRTFTKQELDERATITADIESVTETIKALKEEADVVRTTAKAVVVQTDDAPTQRTTTPHVLNIKQAEDEPGMAFARYVKCHIMSKGIPMLAENIAKNAYPNDHRLHAIIGAETKRGNMFAKADVLGGSSTGTTWAAPLWQYVTIADEFLEWLRPQTILGKFGVGGVPSLTRVPFNARVGQQTSGGTGYWVGEGKPKPLTSFNFNAITMAITKVAAIAVLTQEIMRLSGGDADRLVRNALRGALIERLDRDFIDPDFAGSANVSPASITYGAPTSAASGTTNAFITADTGTAVDALLSALPDATMDGLVWLMSGRRGYRIGQARNSLGQLQFPSVGKNGGDIGGIPVITSEYLAYGGGLSPASNDLMVLVHAPSIFLADDGEVSVVQSTEASLQMLDNPTNDSVTPTPTTMVSMFQTNSVALLAERSINWKRARDGSVYVLTNVAYSGAA